MPSGRGQGLLYFTVRPSLRNLMVVAADDDDNRGDEGGGGDDKF
jgi:hypothetical protein